MWFSVLVLAMAVNFEPTRPTLVPLMLARPRPIAQLAALFFGSFGMGLVAGLLVLFVFHQTPLGTDRTNGAKIQVAIGVTALVVAALTASNIPWHSLRPAFLTSRPVDGAGDGSPGEQRPLDKVAERARAVLRKGNSPWLSFALGLGIGLPSVDYLAVLVVIGASGNSPTTQVVALLMFLLLGNIFVAIPLASYLMAPDSTRRWIDTFQVWIRARNRRQIAGVVAAVGVIQILLGATALWPPGA